MDVVIETQAHPAADADQRPLAERDQAELAVEQRAAEHCQRHAIGLREVRQPIAAAGERDDNRDGADHRDNG